MAERLKKARAIDAQPREKENLPRHRKKTKAVRLQEKRVAMERAIRGCAKSHNLVSQNILVSIVGDQIVVDAQFRLIEKSERPKDTFSSEDELEPTKG